MAQDNSILKILIHTDTHLGYLERDAHRGQDSFAAFEEALYNAKEKKCDMVIHAGDMFHENKPSRQTMHSAMGLFRKYCLGDDAVYFSVLNAAGKKSGAEDVFKPNGGMPNFQSPHQAVSLPYFAIHGNHDDPSREGTTGDALSALDMLSVANLINYFGKSERVDDIVVRPIIIKKKNCKVALYGLGAIRDERLNRMCRNKKVSFVRPADDNDTYFNILVVHQNRDKGRGKNCLRESSIPDWMTLVIWGNEHECVTGLQPSLANSLHILQPGSSVATSLAYTESHDFPKKYAVLEIKEDKKFRVKQHDYQQLRPFVYSNVSLREHLDPRDSKVEEKLKAFLNDRVRGMIEEARKASSVAEESYPGEQLSHRINDPSLVLIRLRVESDGFTNLHVQRFGQKFVGNVANPGDLLLFAKQKREKSTLGSVRASVNKAKGDKGEGEGEGSDDDADGEAVRKIKIEEFVEEQMKANRSLALLPSSNMQAAIEDYVYRKNTSAISEEVQGILRKFQGTMIRDKDTSVNVEDLRESAAKLRKAEDAATNAAKGKEKPRKFMAFSDDEDEPPVPKGAAAPKGRAKKAPAAKKPRAVAAKKAPAAKKSPAAKARPARGKRKTYAESGEDEDEDEASLASSAMMEGEADEDEDESEEEQPKKGRGRKPAAPKKAPARRAKKAAPADLSDDDVVEVGAPVQSQLELAAPPSASAPSQGGSRKRAKPSFMN